jgi:hypothetical protein
MSEPAPAYGDDVAIRFTAQVNKVQTLVDGGMRLTLDINLSAIETKSILALIGAKQPGVLLEVAAIAVCIEKQQENNNAFPTRSEWQS